jgi:hypothetical protein
MPAPDYTIADNPHVFMQCGPITKETIDKTEGTGRDLTLMTQGGCHQVWAKNGNKVEHVAGSILETSGHNLSESPKGSVARSICAEYGDIDIVASNGNIRLTAKNIYFVTSGEKGNGNFILNANGQVTLATGGEMRLASGSMCLVSAKSININSNLRISGKIFKGSAVSSASTLQALLAGNWSQLLTSLAQTCK